PHAQSNPPARRAGQRLELWHDRLQRTLQLSLRLPASVSFHCSSAIRGKFVSSSTLRVNVSEVSVKNNSSVGQTCAFNKCPPCADPSRFPITTCACNLC